MNPTLRDWLGQQVAAAFRTPTSSVRTILVVLLWSWAWAYGLTLIQPFANDLGVYWFFAGMVLVMTAVAFFVAARLIQSAQDQSRLERAAKACIRAATWMILGAMLKAFGSHAAELYETLGPAPAWLFWWMDAADWIAPAAGGVAMFHLVEPQLKVPAREPVGVKIPSPENPMRN